MGGRGIAEKVWSMGGRDIAGKVWLMDGRDIEGKQGSVYTDPRWSGLTNKIHGVAPLTFQRTEHLESQ